jgi:single-strand DNA-binding protein
MRSINKVILIGNVTRDPEMRQTPNGQNVATFGLATNREWVTRDKNRHNLAEFHNLVAWANLADIVSKFVRKGKLLYIEGYLKTRNWDSPEGGKRFKTEVVVQDLVMLDKRAKDETDYIPEEESIEDIGEGIPEEAPAKEKPAKKTEAKKEVPAEEKPAKKTESKKEAPAEEKPAEPEKEEKKKASATAEMDIDSDLGL